MIAGLVVVAMDISEQDMDDAMNEAEDIWKGDIQKNKEAYLNGKCNL